MRYQVSNKDVIMADKISEEMKDQMLGVIDSFYKKDWKRLAEVLPKLQKSTDAMIKENE